MIELFLAESLRPYPYHKILKFKSHRPLNLHMYETLVSQSEQLK